jgi:hypothetical protein
VTAAWNYLDPHPFAETAVVPALDNEIAAARRDLARRVDRVDALSELRRRCVELEDETGRPATIDALLAAAWDTTERARRSALIDRCIDQEE